MSGEKYKQISTILKYQSSSVSTSFPPLRARGKKKKKGEEKDPAGAFSSLLHPVQIVRHEASKG